MPLDAVPFQGLYVTSCVGVPRRDGIFPRESGLDSGSSLDSTSYSFKQTSAQVGRSPRLLGKHCNRAMHAEPLLLQALRKSSPTVAVPDAAVPASSTTNDFNIKQTVNRSTKT